MRTKPVAVTRCPLSRPAGLIEVDTVLDIGPCLQPMCWYKPKRHICVEPYAPYANALVAAGYETRRVVALEALEKCLDSMEQIDAIYAFDVIEHMDRPDGEKFLLLAQELRPKQIVISTPNGFHEQHVDEWEMGGEHWQTHRSGWVPADFPGWRIELYDIAIRIGFYASSP